MTLWADLEARLRSAMQQADQQESELLEQLEAQQEKHNMPEQNTPSWYDLIAALEKAEAVANGFANSRERSLVITKINEAQLWAGNLPEYLNTLPDEEDDTEHDLLADAASRLYQAITGEEPDGYLPDLLDALAVTTAERDEGTK